MALPRFDDPRRGARGIDRFEERFDSRTEGCAGVWGGEVFEHRELARGEPGRCALGRCRGQRAALPDLVEQIGRDGMRRVQRQRGTKRLDCLVPVGLLEMASPKPRPRRHVGRRMLGDRGIHLGRFTTEVAVLRQFERAPFERGEILGRHRKKKLRN